MNLAFVNSFRPKKKAFVNIHSNPQKIKIKKIAFNSRYFVLVSVIFKSCYGSNFRWGKCHGIWQTWQVSKVAQLSPTNHLHELICISKNISSSAIRH